VKKKTPREENNTGKEEKGKLTKKIEKAEKTGRVKIGGEC